MTDENVRKAVEAGVKSIEHGYFASEDTLRLMKEKGVWLSPQPFLIDDNTWDDPRSAAKWKQVVDAVDDVYSNASKIGVKVAFGTDLLLDADGTENQGALLARLGKWFPPHEVLRIATSGNAELLEMAGPRHPYQDGPLGVIKEGAYADLILVDGNPLENLELVADPHSNFVVIMKDGKVYKNALH